MRGGMFNYCLHFSIARVSFRFSHDQDYDTREHVSHDPNAPPPLHQHASGHVPEAGADDFAVCCRSHLRRKWRHAADADAASAAAASSGARVSREGINSWGWRVGGAGGHQWRVVISSVGWQKELWETKCRDPTKGRLEFTWGHLKGLVIDKKKYW